MSKPIPDRVYQKIEYNLHHAKEHQEAVNSFYDDVFGSRGANATAPTKGHGRHSDPTANMGTMLADGNESIKWAKAIGETRCYFAQSKEGQLLESFYGKEVLIKTVAEKMGVDRRTIQTLRDNIVFRCALHAVKYGLIWVEDDNDG